MERNAQLKILILCTGNSCRSQIAQGFLQSYDERIEVHSAGTFPASRVNHRAVIVMAEDGVDISHNIPRPVTEFLNGEWDYVITVCDDAKETCPVFTGKVRNSLHLGFEDPTNAAGSEDYIMSEYRRIRYQIKIEFFKFYNHVLKPQLI